jgi:hypothetical protein
MLGLPNKKKIEYGSFAAKDKKAGKFKILREKISLTILAVVFILGGAIGFYKLFNSDRDISKSLDKASELSELPGWWLSQYFGASVCDNDNCDPKKDPDKDGLNNAQEYYYHTNPLVAFTIGDTMNDGALVAAGFDPSKNGRVTFDEASTPENLLGESLVFGDDVKQLVADSNDISKIVLPEVEEDQLEIVYDTSEQAYKAYASEFQTTVDQYFRASELSYIKNILKSGTDAEVVAFKSKAAGLAGDLKNVPVPLKFLTFHKYNILLFQLLSEIIPAPVDLSGQQSEIWYDKVQAFLAVQQKLDFEKQFLNKEFPQ